MVACPICQNEYNLQENIPLVFTACGHTICSYCLQQMAKFNGIYDLKCPFDKRPLPNPFVRLDSFPKNYELIQALEDERLLYSELALKEATIQNLSKNIVEYEAKETSLKSRVTTSEKQITKMAFIIIDTEKKMKLMAKEKSNMMSSNRTLEKRVSELEQELKMINEQYSLSKNSEEELQKKIAKQQNEKLLLKQERDMYQNMYLKLCKEHSSLQEKISKDLNLKRETENTNKQILNKSSFVSTDENLATEIKDDFDIKLRYQMYPLENKPNFKSTLKPQNLSDSKKFNCLKIQRSSSTKINLNIDLPLVDKNMDYTLQLLQSLVSPPHSHRSYGFSTVFSENSALQTILKGKLIN